MARVRAPRRARLRASKKARPGIAWLLHLREHFERAVWLNPEPPRGWAGSTIETIASIFPMFPLTLDGLSDAVSELVQRLVTATLKVCHVCHDGAWARS